jgi:hypothetical protein
MIRAYHQEMPLLVQKGYGAGEGFPGSGKVSRRPHFRLDSFQAALVGREAASFFKQPEEAPENGFFQGAEGPEHREVKASGRGFFHFDFFYRRVFQGQDGQGVSQKTGPPAHAFDQGNAGFRQGYGQGYARQSRPGSDVGDEGESRAGGLEPQQASQGGEGVKDVFDRKFAPVLCAYKAVGGVKAFYFLDIAGKEGGNPVEAAVKKAGRGGILPAEFFKAPE